MEVSCVFLPYIFLLSTLQPTTFPACVLFILLFFQTRLPNKSPKQYIIQASFWAISCAFFCELLFLRQHYVSFIHVKNCYSFPLFPTIPSYAHTTVYQISVNRIGVFGYYRWFHYKYSCGYLLELIRFFPRYLLRSGIAKSRWWLSSFGCPWILMCPFSLSWMSPEGIWVQSSLGGGGAGEEEEERKVVMVVVVVLVWLSATALGNQSQEGLRRGSALIQLWWAWVWGGVAWLKTGDSACSSGITQFPGRPLSSLCCPPLALDIIPTSLSHGSHCFVVGLAFWKGITHSGSLTSRTWCSRRGAPSLICGMS